MAAYDLLTRWHQLAMSPQYRDAAGILLTREPIVAETKAFLTDAQTERQGASWEDDVSAVAAALPDHEPVTYDQILTLLQDTVDLEGYNDVIDQDSLVAAARKLADMFGIEVPKTKEQIEAEELAKQLARQDAIALDDLKHRFPTYEKLREHLGPLGDNVRSVSYNDLLEIAVRLR